MLVKHPDKQPDNPNAAAEFAEIQKAYEFLLDDKARAAYDEWRQAKAARVQRDAAQSDKRRKMREDLDKRERQVASERSEEETARARLKVRAERASRCGQEVREPECCFRSFAASSLLPPRRCLLLAPRLQCILKGIGMPSP